MEDCAIVDLYWARSEAAIQETDAKYGARCRSLAFNILKNHEDSEECVNDTYMKAWNAMPQQRPTLLSAFIMKITRNLSLNRYNAARAKKRGGDTVTMLLDELEDCLPARGTIESKLDERETAALIDRFLWELDADSRRFFVRRYFFADRVSDVAERFGTGESRVKSSLMRTRNRLRTFLESEGVEL